MKEANHRVLKLIENWADEESIAGIIDMDRMARREDFGELEKWMHQPRFIGRHSKKNTNVFQNENNSKHKIGLSTKLTNAVYTQRIGCIAGENIQISSEKWHQKHMGKELRVEEEKL